ncbi:hypothetical protein B0H13DRAFT_1858974 [Mycena leptocephala]|nr:hypothetical protein B0H13DRAFT_1858974 [Mycena leptocephala]
MGTDVLALVHATAPHPSLPTQLADGPPPEEPRTKRHCSHGNIPAEKRAEQKTQRSARQGDFLTSDNFSVLENASVASTGWEGTRPPTLARKKIDRLYGNEPDAKGIPREERATFFVDRDGLIFMYRSYRVAELMARADEIQHAHDVLVGSNRTSHAWQEHYRKGQLGDHIAIIFGHHRQSAQAPQLTKWHLDHMDRVNEFMQLPIVKAMILAPEEVWHQTDVWPLLEFVSQRLVPGQTTCPLPPSADKKNQIGVCVLLIYALKTALRFDHCKYTWLVIWEAGVAVELPPWVILIYPSALFYHFNLDVSPFLSFPLIYLTEIQFVTTDGYIKVE